MHTACLSSQPLRSYLIVMREPLFAQDLSQSILEHAPDADVRVAASIADAVRELDGMTHLVMAFIMASPQDFVDSGLARIIAEMGARPVLIGDPAERHAPTDDWGVLLQPFSSETVLLHLTASSPIRG